MSQTSNNFTVTGLGPMGDGQWQPPFQLVDDAGVVQFAVAFDGTLTTGASLINTSNPYTFASTLSVTGNFAVNTNKFTVTASNGNTAIAGTLAVTGILTCSALIDLSGIAAGSSELKIAATSDTPTVAFTDSGAANHAPTTAPAGYLKVTVGSSSRYLPFWA